MPPLHHSPGIHRSRVFVYIDCSYQKSPNRDGRIRTGDLLLPRQADYQTFLHPGLPLFEFPNQRHCIDTTVPVHAINEQRDSLAP